MRPTVAHIDLSALRHNLKAITKLAGVGVIPVVKADAYGHGAVTAAWVLAEEGVELMAVACLEEAMDIVEAGVPARFLIMGSICDESALLETPSNCVLVVWDENGIKLAAAMPGAAGRPVEVHLKVNTGMGRLGCEPGDVDSLIDSASGHEHLRITGMMSHMSCADGCEPDDEPFSREQINKFNHICEKSPKGMLRHLAGSASLVKYPESRMDAVRPGLMVYGIWPFEGNKPVNGLSPADLKPVMSLKTRVMAIREIEAGVPVGYGRTFAPDRPSRIAVLPIGYADGVSRILGNRGQVIIGGKRRNIVGRVSMDYITVDVTGDPPVNRGSEVVLIGEQGGEKITAWDVAGWADTIPYEVTCAISARVPRLATDDYGD